MFHTRYLTVSCPECHATESHTVSGGNPISIMHGTIHLEHALTHRECPICGSGLTSPQTNQTPQTRGPRPAAVHVGDALRACL